MTAAHHQNYHHPVNHNERVKRLIRKFDLRLKKAKAERQELLNLERDGYKLCFADEAQCSSLFIQVRDLTDTVLQLEALILPEDN
jgi:hypothetical protein